MCLARFERDKTVRIMEQYLPILVLMVLGALFAGLSFVASGILAPRKKPSEAKLAPYECGIVPTRDLPQRFPVRFYLVAMIFVIFDIEIVFLYPWAVVFKQLGTFGLLEVVVFAGIVFVTFLYLVSNGAFDWGPVRKWRPAASQRTVENTVTRITARQSARVPGETAVVAAKSSNPGRVA
jgi:NADH-quinone oxidoreductase subunit A